MDAPHLACPKLVAGQTSLTPKQQAYARQLAQERLATLLSCEPMDESEAENDVHQAYRAFGLESPHVHWCSSPAEFAQSLFLREYPDLTTSGDQWERVFGKERYVPRNARPSTLCGLAPTRDAVHPRVWKQVMEAMVNVWRRSPFTASIRRLLGQLDVLVADIAEDHGYWRTGPDGILDYVRADFGEIGWYSTMAYWQESVLASAHFFHQVFAPNDLIYLALLNLMVSGYYLGRKNVLLVRKPIHLEFDEQGRWHSASRKCFEYQDGWGLYAWHGVWVPERIILHREQLSLADWQAERNPQVKRVIRERLGPQGADPHTPAAYNAPRQARRRRTR